jgi:APA family basic amino acid/polyamine antiporter
MERNYLYMNSSLKKTLGLGDALALGIGTMIGAGIFMLTGIVASLTGPGAIYAYAVAGAIIMCTALSFAELATAMPSAGGPYTFVKHAFSPFWGFVAGWSLWIGQSLGCAFYIIGFSQYTAYFLPWLPWKLVAFGFLITMISIHIRGSKESTQLQSASVLILLGILLVYLVLGIREVDNNLHEPLFPYGLSALARSAAFIIISFLGFESISTAAEEIKNPRIVVPLATILSVVIVTLLYMGVAYTATGIVSYRELGLTTTPIADTARVFMGPIGSKLIGFGCLLATLSSANAGVLAASRISFAMSRDGVLPGFLQKTHTLYNTPTAAIYTTGVIIAIALIRGNIHWLTEASSFLHLYPFILVNLALLQLRLFPDYRPAFKVPFGPVIPLIGAASCLGLILQIDRQDVLLGVLLICLGFFAYFARNTRA